MADRKRQSADDYFSYQANKFKPKLSYPDSKMRVYTKPEPLKPQPIEVEESTASDSMVVRIIKAFKGED